jgi:hypothetical protein
MKAANASIRRVPRTARTVVLVLVGCFGSVSAPEAEPSVGKIRRTRCRRLLSISENREREPLGAEGISCVDQRFHERGPSRQATRYRRRTGSQSLDLRITQAARRERQQMLDDLLVRLKREEAMKKAAAEQPDQMVAPKQHDEQVFWRTDG